MPVNLTAAKQWSERRQALELAALVGRAESGQSLYIEDIKRLATIYLTGKDPVGDLVVPKDAVKGVWSSSYRWGGDFMEGAVMFVMQRVYDAAWAAFGDEVDRLRAK